MAQNGAEILAQSNLSGNDFKVLMKLLSVLDYENLIQVSQGMWHANSTCIDNTFREALNG